jgi:hypothetical protein
LRSWGGFHEEVEEVEEVNEVDYVDRERGGGGGDGGEWRAFQFFFWKRRVGRQAGTEYPLFGLCGLWNGRNLMMNVNE